jgi:hypothetical protein
MTPEDVSQVVALIVGSVRGVITWRSLLGHGHYTTHDMSVILKASSVLAVGLSLGVW